MREEQSNVPRSEVVNPTTSAAKFKIDQPIKATFSVLLILLSLSTGFLGGWLGAERQEGNKSGSNTTRNQQVILSESELISDIAKRVAPSVVSVDVTSRSTQLNSLGSFQPIQQQSAGTGIIIDADKGIIVTNRHVVPAGTTTLSVTLSDGTKLDKVSVIGRTSDGDSLDVAFLKVTDRKNKTLVAAALGDSSKVRVGDKVIAIGNALGQFQNTVTSGIISGFGRNVVAGDSEGRSNETLQNLFQTDAAINQGNSGGPLVNINGEVVGVNTAVAGGEAQNIGFAIPLNDIQGLIKSVLEKGVLERPYLGVRYVSLTDDVAYELNVNTKRGAYVVGNSGQAAIVPGSPASKAGLRENDIITKVNNTQIDETHSLTSLVSNHKVGEEVTLTIIREGKEQTIKAKLEAQPQG